MDVKEAVRTAKEYLADLFDDEQLTNVGLEEVELDNPANVWKITLGFSRPWSQNSSLRGLAFEQVRPPTRSYKVIRINKGNGQIESLKDRLLRDSE